MQVNIATGTKKKTKCPPYPNVNLRVKGLGKYYNICEKRTLKKAPLRMKHRCTRRNTPTTPETPILTNFVTIRKLFQY